MQVLLLFFCSGATGLIYEVIWSKYLSLLFGSTVQAQTVVLAIFMGGLALGYRLFGRRADRVGSPLALYGYLEGAIGLYAFFFPNLYRLADAVFAGLGAPLLAHPAALLALKGVLSAALLLGPTVLMGGTLPLLAAWLQKHAADPGRGSARFYSINSLGAVCGAALAGFYLVTWLGMSATLQLIGLVNVAIGCAALGLARFGRTSPSANSIPASEPPPMVLSAAGAGEPVRVLRSGCLLVALTGAVSMGLEVLASRCLGLLFGASLQAFAIVLMAFILGIGLGGAAVASRKSFGARHGLATVLLVLGAAVWVGFLIYHLESLARVYAQARLGLADTPMGYRFYQVLIALFSLVVLGVPAAALGAVLPLWIRAVSETSDLLGDRVGRLLTWNTLGAVAGVLITGFVLMPRLGLRGSFAALALLLGLAALAVALATGRRLLAVGAVAICVLLGFISLNGGQGWRQVLSSGVFRLRGQELVAAALQPQSSDNKLLFYEDAPDATVTVEDGPAPGSQGRQLGLRVNGKPDASTIGDLSTQLLLAHLPLMVKPESREVFVFGLGSGITAGALLEYPLERLTIAENCDPVVNAARFFERENRGVLANPRARLCREDARTVLKLTRDRFDVIIAEPSNPWTVGVGSVFSREFYELAAARLQPDGIMAQWFHVYEMNDGIVELVLRTFNGVFPVMEIWDTGEGDIVMLGSRRPWKTGPEVFARTLQMAEPAKDLARVGLLDANAVLARQIASQRTGFAVTGPGPIQSDEFPVLEYAAPRAFFVGSSSELLWRFDERTWQAELASPEKRRALVALNPASLTTAFGGIYESVNPDVQAAVRRRVAGAASAAPRQRLAGGMNPPCLFEDNIHLTPPAAALTNGAAKSLFDAELALHAGSSDAAVVQAIDSVAAIISAAKSGEPAAQGWHPDYYACLAAKASAQRGNPEQALAIVRRGLQLNPTSSQLAFLARVLLQDRVVAGAVSASPRIAFALPGSKQ